MEGTTPQQEPPLNTQKRSIPKWVFLLILALIMLVLALGSYILINRAGISETIEEPTPTPIISQEPTIEQEAEKYDTYVNESNNWQIEYLKDMRINVHGKEQIGQSAVGNVVVFSKVGPTQAEGTEFYDGISFTVGVKEKSKDQTLMEFADKDSTPSDPEVSSRTALKTIEVNGHDGVETEVSGLGK